MDTSNSCDIRAHTTGLRQKDCIFIFKLFQLFLHTFQPILQVFQRRSIALFGLKLIKVLFNIADCGIVIIQLIVMFLIIARFRPARLAVRFRFDRFQAVTSLNAVNKCFNSLDTRLFILNLVPVVLWVLFVDTNRQEVGKVFI